MFNIVFMGTSPFAATILQHIHEWIVSTSAAAQGHLAAVYCQPDRPAGRGHKLTPPPTKILAETLGLPVLQPLNFREQHDRDALAAFKPHVLVVAAYGLLLPQTVLDIPTYGAINVHASLLPQHRGAAPIERALIQGDTQTGITIMRMEAGLDSGPMIKQKALGIGLDDTAADLHAELAQLGGQLMSETLAQLIATQTTLPHIEQDHTRATYAAKLNKQDGFIDWTQPVHAVHAQIRGTTPRPGARTVLHINGTAVPVQLEAGRYGVDFASPLPTPTPTPGTVLGLDREALLIACADKAYRVAALRPAGRKTMNAVAFWNGYLREVSETVIATPV